MRVTRSRAVRAVSECIFSSSSSSSFLIFFLRAVHECVGPFTFFLCARARSSCVFGCRDRLSLIVVRAHLIVNRPRLIVVSVGLLCVCVCVCLFLPMGNVPSPQESVFKLFRTFQLQSGEKTKMLEFYDNY